MQFSNYLKRKIPHLAILALAIGLTSCGSYQYVGVDNDGIYGDTPITITIIATIIKTTLEINLWNMML